ncbi:MAG: hypothetical protein E7381_03570 [Clostridiales bacterium]|nr:hypothetical protein [Clostridiales bacterium]
MSTVKMKLRKFGRLVWESVKGGIPALLMYFCAGSVLMMITMKEEKFVWDNSKLIWTIVCIAVAVAYNGLIAYAHGGNAYQMLVSGNMKRHSLDAYGQEFKISFHKEAKEYRAWKGFAMGVLTAVFTVIGAIIFGKNQQIIDSLYTGVEQSHSTGFGILVIACFLLSGWSLLPVYFMNVNGWGVSYYFSALFGIIPILATGVIYIAGAYAKRNKTIREQERRDRESAAQEQKIKKINYGGLPGTKPKKRK